MYNDVFHPTASDTYITHFVFEDKFVANMVA